MKFVSCGKMFLGVFLLNLLAACATNTPGNIERVSAPQTAEEKVVSRAQARWDALRAGNYEKAYSYITPATRMTLPLEVFRGRISGGSWLDVKVTKAVCEPEVCDVSVRIEYFVLPNLRDSQTVNEKWILDGGNWWFVYRG